MEKILQGMRTSIGVSLERIGCGGRSKKTQLILELLNANGGDGKMMAHSREGGRGNKK